MDNGSSRLLDDPFFENVKKDKTATVDPFFEKIKENETGKAAIRMRQSRNLNPQDYIEAKTLAPELPPELVTRNLDQVRDAKTIQRNKEILKNNSYLRSYTANDPDFVKSIRNEELGFFDDLTWMLRAGQGAFSEGVNTVNLGDIRYRQVMGTATPEEIEKANAMSMSQADDYDAKSWMAKGWVEAVRMVPYMGSIALEGVSDGAKGAGIGAVAGGSAALLLGQAGPQIATPEEIVTVPVSAAGGAAAGFKVGSTYGSMKRTYELSVGLAFDEISQLRDENGDYLDTDVARGAAMIAGLGIAGLESFGLSQILKNVPHSDKLFGGLGTKGIVEAIKNPTVAEAVKQFGKNIAGSMASEITTEVMQEGVQILANELSKDYSGQAFVDITPEELTERLAETAVATAQAMSVIGPIANGQRVMHDIGTAISSEKANAELAQVMEKFAENPDIAPEVVESSANQLSKGTDKEYVQVDARKLVEYFQTKGVDPYEAGAKIPEWAKNVQESLNTGEDISIPLGSFLAHIANNAQNADVLDFAKFDVSKYSPSEIQEFKNQYAELLEVETRRASNEMATEKFESVDLFQEAGFDESTSQQYAALYDSFIDTLASKTGVSYQQIKDAINLQIQRVNTQDVEGQIDDKTGSMVKTSEGYTINLFEKNDLSTMLHESGHVFLDVYSSLANSNETMTQEWAKITEWLGVEGEITTEQHEKWAKSFEAYLMEGKAPSAKLETAFSRFKTWLGYVYRNITRLGGKVSPEAKNIFDNMLASEAEINKMAEEYEYAPMAVDLRELGVSEQEYAEYQQFIEQAKGDAQNKMRSRVIGEQKSILKGWMKEVRDDLQRDLMEAMGKLPIYQFRQEIKDKNIKIAGVERGSIAGMPKYAYSREGVDIGVLAELYGFDTVDEFIKQIEEAGDIKEKAKELATLEMHKRYGDDFTQAEIVDAMAKRSMANDARVSVLAMEYSVLMRKAGKRNPVNAQQVANRIADKALADRNFYEIDKVHKTQAALRRASKAAEQAMIKGDWQEAAAQKRKQLVAQAIATKAEKIRTRVDKTRRYALKLTKKPPRNIAPEYMEQLQDIVGRFGFADISSKKAKDMADIRLMLDQALEEGLVPMVTASVLIPDRRINFKELKVEELLGLLDTIDNLAHLGRETNKINVEGKKLDQALIVSEIADKISSLENAQKFKDVKIKPGSFKALLNKGSTALLKIEQLVEWLDGGDPNGPMSRYVWQPIVEAEGKRNNLEQKYIIKLQEIFENFNTKRMTKAIKINSLEEVFTIEEIYAVALNTGNASNYEKMMYGEKWNQNNVDEILSHLDKSDWDRIQKIWDTIESLWPQIEELHRKLTGIVPERIEPVPFENVHGQYNGGYYPAVYDYDRMAGYTRETEDGLFNNEYITPTTNKGYTESRTGVKRPIKRSLTVLPNHLSNVIHDLTHREAIRAVYKVISSPEVAQYIDNAEGKAARDQFMYWLKAVARQNIVDNSDAVSNFVRAARTNATIMGIGFRLSTVAAQGLGLFPALTRVGGRHLSGAMRDYFTAPQDYHSMVIEKSDEMKFRFNNIDRDVKDAIESSAMGGNKIDKIRRAAYYMIGMADRAVATPVWMGAYNQALEKGMTDAEAAHAADRVVRLTQGTGSIKDQPLVQRGSEVSKLFTLYYSFFSAQHNMQVDLTRKTRRAILDGSGKDLGDLAMKWTYLVVFPAILAPLMVGDGPDEDENPAAWAARKVALYPFAAVPFIRDIVGSWDSGFDYTMSPVSRIGTSIVNLGDEFVKAAEGEPDPLGMATDAMDVSGYLFGLPLGQVKTTIKALAEAHESGEINPAEILFGVKK